MKNAFLKSIAILMLLGCSAASMAEGKSHSPIYFVDHELIKPGDKLVVLFPNGQPNDAQDYLECYQEGGAPDETKALATMTWNYKGGEYGAMIDGNKRYGRMVALRTEFMKNPDPIARLVDKSGKIVLENIGKVDIVVGCRYSETIW